MMSDLLIKSALAFDDYNIQLSTIFVKRFNPVFEKFLKIFNIYFLPRFLLVK